MKNSIVLILFLAIAACSVDNGKPLGGVKAQGGVDVGNAPAIEIPLTRASISYPASWESSVRDDVLYIDDKSGSSIEAKKSEITDLSSPTATGLQRYLKAKFPDRDYKQTKINGLEGVRAELVNSRDEKSSDMYLVSEEGDFLHLRSYLKDGGIATGDKILLTIRVEYRGLPVPLAPPKTVRLESESGQDGNHDHRAYAFLGDCFRFADPGCNPWGGVAVSAGRNFEVGAAGFEHGRIVELGPESQIPFDSVRVQGKYLVAPLSNTLISDIYTAFTPPNSKPDSEPDSKPDQDQIRLRQGYTYLVRTIKWPDEDLITKMSVVEVTEDHTVIRYQKLVAVDKDDLRTQIDAVNKNTLEREVPMSEGEVTLFDRGYWHNYFYSSFNFEFSTSGNMFITNNTWDLSVDSTCTGELALAVPGVTQSLGEVVDLGARDLEAVTLSDFKTPSASQRGCGVRAILGHIYTTFRTDQITGATTLGAVQVLELDPQGRWARFRFRRMKVVQGKFR